MGILARGKYVITDAAAGADAILSDGAVYISAGKVVESGDFAALKEKYPDAVIKGNGRQLLMPGLIDGHSHGWGLTAIQRGVLFDFLENAIIDWAQMVAVDPDVTAMMSAIRHLRSGCTTMHHNNSLQEPMDMEAAQKKIEGYKKVGVRLAYSPGGFNVNRLALDDTDFFATLPPELQERTRAMVYFDKDAVVEKYFDFFESIYDRYNDDDMRVIFGPSWVQGCTPEFLQRIKARADELGKLPIHVHTLQTPIQKAYGLRKYGKSLVAYMDDLGVLDENLTLGHAVYVSEADIELLAERRASTTNHSSCNFNVRNGISPVYFLHRAGVNVALGIDDKGINDDEDAIMELRMMHKLHRLPGFDLANTPALTAFDILEMGTTNAARVCGFAGELGALVPGMKADAILVDLEEVMEDPWMSPHLDIAEIFIHRAMGRHVNTVIVGGEVVMEDRRFLTIDVEALYDEVRKQAARGIGPEQRHYAETLQMVKPHYQKWYEDWVKMEYKPFYVLNSRI